MTGPVSLAAIGVARRPLIDGDVHENFGLVDAPGRCRRQPQPSGNKSNPQETAEFSQLTALLRATYRGLQAWLHDNGYRPTDDRGTCASARLLGQFDA